MLSVESRVIQELNAAIGPKSDNLSKSHELVDKYVKQLNGIEEKVRTRKNLHIIDVHCLRFHSFQLSTSPILKSAFEGAKHSIDDADERLQNADDYTAKIDRKIAEFREINENISSNLEKIHELEHLIEYYKVLQDVQDISNELTSCIHSKEEQKIVNLFLSLCGCPSSQDSVIGRLQDVDAPHMKLYARRMALYWHDIIRDKLSRYAKGNDPRGEII
jgi:RAD50-interacting protein 1